jgi:hypothetical protein
MTTEHQIEQAERRRVFAQDQSVQRQATTMHQFAQADAQTPRGRFSAVDAASVIGATAVPNYPAAASQRDPVPPENPLGYSIDAMEPSTVSSFPVEQTGDPTDPASTTPLAVERVGSSLSQSGDPTPGSRLPPGPARMTRDVGSPVPYRRF